MGSLICYIWKGKKFHSVKSTFAVLTGKLFSASQLICFQISGPEVFNVVLAVAIYQERRKKLLICPESPYFS